MQTYAAWMLDVSTVILFMLHNYEMKDERYCFIVFMTAKYRRNNIMIGQNFDIVETLLSQTKINVSFGIKGIVWPDQCLLFQTILIITRYFIQDERDL
jgi:hypothetical protein